MKRAIRVGGIAAFVFLCLVLLVGFLAVSFEAALYFLVGLLASLVALGLLPRFLARISLLLAAATALLIAAASIVSIHYGIIVGAGPTAMTGYQAELVPDPHSNDPNRFLLSEHFQYIHPPAARHGDTYGQFTGSEVIEARSNGFAVHEIDFFPSQPFTVGFFTRGGIHSCASSGRRENTSMLLSVRSHAITRP